jgi:hypothetical protein
MRRIVFSLCVLLPLLGIVLTGCGEGTKKAGGDASAPKVPTPTEKPKGVQTEK